MFGFGPSDKSLEQQIAELETASVIIPPVEVQGPTSAFGHGFTPQPVPVMSRGLLTAERMLGETAQWYQEIQPLVNEKVRTFLDDPEGIFAVDLANVATFAKSIAPKVAILGECYSRMLKAEVLAKQQVDDLEHEVKVQEAIVRRELKFGEGMDGRKPVRAALNAKATVADLDGEIQLDRRVANARLAVSEYKQNQLAELVEIKARLHYALRAIDRMCSVIPGLQGVSRDLLRGEAL